MTSSPLLASDDSIEPATPRRQPRIICLDSSPAQPATSFKTTTTTANATAAMSSRFQAAMDGPRSTMTKTQFSNSSSPTKPISFSSSSASSSSRLSSSINEKSRSMMASKPSQVGSKDRPISLDSPASSSNPKVRSSLFQFRFSQDKGKDPHTNGNGSCKVHGNGNGNGKTLSNGNQSKKSAPSVNSDLSDADSASSSSSRSSVNEKPNPKRRRLIRGGTTSNGHHDPPTDSSPPKRRSPSPVAFRKLSPPPAVPSPPVKANPTANQPVTTSDLREKAKRIMSIKPHWKPLQVLSTLKELQGDVAKTISKLEAESKPVFSIQMASLPSPVPNRPNKPSSIAAGSKPSPVQISSDAEPIAIDDDSDSDSDQEVYDRSAKEDRAAFQFFNSADQSALMDTTNCSEAQAKIILSLRPFTHADDIEAKLGRAKGVTPRIFSLCKDLMAGYHEVDQVLAKVEKIGKVLSSTMASWFPDATALPSSRLGSPALAANHSREGTPSNTLNLAHMRRGGVVKDKYYMEDQPKLLGKGVELKDYQIVGVNWLSLLYRKNTSAILADEMGLGKTAQVISFLAHLKETGVKGPHLIVAPSSVLENWDREFRFFAPDIYVRRYWGSQKERIELRDELRQDTDVEVILTTYEMASGGPQDHSFLRKRGFNCCVFDEGHMLKNRKSQKYEKLIKIRCNWRLLVTGTPLQNNLQELVSLLNFIMPDYFSDAEEALSAIFKVKHGGKQDQLSRQRVDRAKKMMRPFVLRRLKEKVLDELPTKTVQVEYCDMTPVQHKTYLEALARTKAAVQGELETALGSAVRAAPRTRGGTMSNKSGHPSGRDTGHVLMELRKAANHPLLTRRLFDEKKIDAMARDLLKEPDYADSNFVHVKEDLRINTDAQLSFSANTYPSTRKHMLPPKEWMNSGKVQALQRLIPEIQAKGERILIFSQFTMVLDILCVCLENMGVKYVGFTGATNVEDRQVLVDQFTHDPEITVFLLSTKAGGLGINLVAANWVILFDQDFNPQNDKQAADRCYRMGQKKPVTVIKLISRGTIDEDIHALGEKKLELAQTVSGEGELDSDEWEQKKTTQTLLAKLRDQAAPEVIEIDDGDDKTL